MKNNIFIFLALFLFIQTSAFSQDKVFALRQSREQGFLFINPDGDELFKLPAGHDPTVRLIKEPMKLGNFYTIDFSENILPVRNGEHYYLVNKEGEKTTDLNDHMNWVSPFQNGFFRAYERYNGQRNSSMIVYLDKNGKECFGGTRYWEGSPFKDGAAIVQLKDKEGDWLLIDTLGQEKLNLSDTITGSIRSYTITTRGMWKLTVKVGEGYSYKSVYLRPDGLFSFIEMDLFEPHEMGHLGDLPNTGLEVDDRIRQRIRKLPMLVFPSFYQDSDYGYYLFEDKSPDTGEEKMAIYDHHYNIVTLPTENGEEHEYLEFFDHYLLIKKTTTDGTTSFVYVDFKDMSFGLEVDNPPYGARVDDGLLIYETETIFDLVTAHKIIKLTGEVIYEPSVEETIFTDLDAAFAYGDQVRELHLNGFGLMNLYALPLLSNLEVLKIDKGFGQKLPNGILSQLPHFRSLHLSNCENLNVFPDDLNKVENLSMIFISDCPQLKGLEDLIPELSALKTIRSDYSFSPQQLKELKAAFPQIEFEFLLEVVGED